MNQQDPHVLKLSEASALEKHTDEDIVSGSGVLTLKQFELLFHKNQQFLCMVAEKIVRNDLIAEDLVQDFFIRCWESRNRIRYQSFEAFAYRAIKNSCIDYLRKQQSVDQKLSQMPGQGDKIEPEEIPVQDARLKKILELLDELPAERRKIFELHVLDGLSYKEIAGELGISVNTVKTQLKRAYLSLRGKAVVLLILNYLMKFL